jgi:hypothetical protein
MRTKKEQKKDPSCGQKTSISWKKTEKKGGLVQIFDSVFLISAIFNGLNCFLVIFF